MTWELIYRIALAVPLAVLVTLNVVLTATVNRRARTRLAESEYQRGKLMAVFIALYRAEHENITPATLERLRQVIDPKTLAFADAEVERLRGASIGRH